MKRIVCTLLMAIAMTTGFAQTTPDYVQKAKAGLTQYYPQFKNYFEPIFAKIMGLKENSRNLINSKIHENFDTFADEISSDKDKNAVVLLVLEEFVGGDQFKKSAVFDVTNEDIRIGVADEINYDLKLIIKKELRDSRKELEDSRMGLEDSRRILAIVKERNTKLKEIINTLNNSTNNKEITEKIAIQIEDYYKLFEVSDIKDDTGIQKIIKQYINLNKQINRRPSAIGQKFIDEYNRINH